MRNTPTHTLDQIVKRAIVFMLEHWGFSVRQMQVYLANRGLDVHHSTINRWERAYRPRKEWTTNVDLGDWRTEQYKLIDGRYLFLCITQNTATPIGLVALWKQRGKDIEHVAHKRLEADLACYKEVPRL